MSEPVDFFQYRAEIEGSSPPVWREFYIPEICSFYDLRAVIQIAFGWVDLFPHKFTCGFEIGDIDEFLFPIVLNERLVGLDQASDQDVIYECNDGQRDYVIRLVRAEANFEGGKTTGIPEVIGGDGFPDTAKSFKSAKKNPKVNLEALNRFLASFPFEVARDWDTAQKLRKAVDAVALETFKAGVAASKASKGK